MPPIMMSPVPPAKTWDVVPPPVWNCASVRFRWFAFAYPSFIMVHSGRSKNPGVVSKTLRL